MELPPDCESDHKPPVIGNHKIVTEEAPSWLPQERDQLAAKTGTGGLGGEMGPIGPWATGRVDWGPLSGLTGTRPVVDHYSTTRFSEAEWRKHNAEVLGISSDDLHRANMAEYNSRRGLQCISASADKNQHMNTQRSAEVLHNLICWKSEVERALQEMSEEIILLESQKRRANQARAVLHQVKSISSECLARRAMREGHELARDIVEEELIKEAALVKEVEDLLNRTLLQIEEQQIRNKSAKARLEDDWSDKQEAYEIHTTNCSLKTSTNTVLFKPSATRFTENQSTPGGCEHNTKEILSMAEAVRGQSCELRSMLDGPILSDCTRDLKAQADRVDIALARRISETDQCVKAMYADLDVVVRRNSESEKLIQDLQRGVRGMDKAIKVAQTRLDNLQRRPRVENCRDKAQFGLIDEVKSLAEQTSAMKGQLQEAEDSLHGLVKARGILEKEIQDKLKTLYIDKERCQTMRAQYPSATALTGH